MVNGRRRHETAGICDIWQDIAKRYADNTTVIGYNLLNEPIPHYFEKDTLKPHLEPLYKKG
ncbi:MAG: cellulase family glycosylhydrolase [Lewinellaceae bacterium]|nr:cellulase family glycosylhydrolase [Lewinellaceae bacterium]